MGSEIKAVKEVLPHREPFLFLDEVTALDERSVTARRTVRADEPQFAGHYPHKPLMPGVLLCEAVLQAGAYWAATRPGATAGGTPVVGRMNKVKFKRMVSPGDVLEISAESVETVMGAQLMKGRVKRDGQLVCSLEFTVLTVTEEGQL